MIKFETGKTYHMRSICDYNCIWDLTIISRTAKTVTIKIENEVKRFRVKEHDGAEFVMPLGSFSMSPALSASKELKPNIRLVVYNRHTLGYVCEEQPQTLFVLHYSPLRANGLGLIVNPFSFCITNKDDVKLASEKDFEDFNVSFNGYKKDPQYIYSKQTEMANV